MSDEPRVHEVDPSQAAAAARDAATVKQAAARLAESNVSVPAEEARRFRTFVAAAQYRNHKFLIKRGQVVQFRDPNSPTGSRDARREGDKFARFAGGVLVTDDADIITWCEQNRKVCRDATDPRAAAWAQLKEGQIDLAARERVIDGSLDVDQMLYPDGGESGVDGLGAAILSSSAREDVTTARSNLEHAERMSQERQEQLPLV
jgi:hypothetical protein